MNRPATPFLPYGRQLVEDDDLAAVADVMRGDWLTTGPTTRKFEEAFARTTGVHFAVSCSSGTAALHLAALALDLGTDDAVIVPTMTFLATANVVRFVGAEVVFADVDPDTGLMGEEELRAALDRARRASIRVKAVFPVHLNGQCVDMEGIAEVAAEHGLRVVEDACHAIGGAYVTKDGETVSIGACRHADMGVFSFHPVKTVTMGEGGAVTINDDALCRRVRRLRNHGMMREPEAFEQVELAFDEGGKPNPWYYEMLEPGFNYRASDIHCALGLSQLTKLKRFVAERQALVERYDARIRVLAPLVKPLARRPQCRPAWHLYVVFVDFEKVGVSRCTAMRTLRERSIGSQVHYLPVHMQPYYRRRYGEQRLPGAEKYYAKALSLPLFPAMKPRDIDRVVHALGEAIGYASLGNSRERPNPEMSTSSATRRLTE